VLVVRVRNLVPPEVWERRYDHIRDFERMLADEGTIILKFFLHISKDEQASRLQARLDDPEKHWKFSPADLEERKLWDVYQEAFQVALTRTSTPWAPWYAVPADSKWYRNLVVARVLVDTLERLEMRFPESSLDLEGIRVE
jgi:polyphosphate kinase 2 (PPK2 family)